MAGGKRRAVGNKFGLIDDGDCATADVHDQTFQLTLTGRQCFLSGGWGVGQSLRRKPESIAACRFRLAPE